jgi:HlyD family secretion protein
MLRILTSEQKKKLLLLQITVVLVSLVELVGVASIGPFMAVAANPAVVESNQLLKKIFVYFEFRTVNQFLIALGGVVFVVLLLGNVLIFFSNWFSTSFGMTLGRTISVNLYRHYLSKDYLFHTTSNSAILAKNIFHEVLRVTNNIIVQFLLLVSKVFTIIFIVTGLILISPALTVVIAVALGGFYLLIYLFTKRVLHENGVECSRLLGNAFQAVNEGLNGIKDVKLHGKEFFYSSLFDKILKRYNSVSIFNAVLPLAPRYALEVLTFGGVIVGFVYFLEQGKNISEFLPVLSIFAVAGLKLIPALQQVFASMTVMRGNMNSFHIISADFDSFSSLNQNLEIGENKQPPFAEFQTLELKNLSFRYPQSNVLAIKNVSLSLNRNTTSAFVGMSGSGKSTIVDIVSGLLKPLDGSILIDQYELKDENIRGWQKEIGYVSQNVYLMDGTFSENIAFGEIGETIDEDRVARAAKMARLDDVIAKSPKGFATTVGERGIQLSGGQRQRLGIARALYRDPAVLIFDEATSALDNITESEIMEAIKGLSGKKTIILIAHRLTTVKYCDQIFLMDSGEVIASGKYQTLLDTNKLFQDMVRV